jgi:hypothetical protein
MISALAMVMGSSSGVFKNRFAAAPACEVQHFESAARMVRWTGRASNPAGGVALSSGDHRSR